MPHTVSTSSPSIFIKNATFAYDNIILFDNLNLTLQSGKWTCLLGPSGIGKSTLLRFIANLTPSFMTPSSVIRGEISCDSQNPLASQMAYMAQTDLLLPWLTALENALLCIRLRYYSSVEKKSLQEQAKELFIQMGLSQAENLLPKQLSGGMRQRVSLIRTLIENKPVVLMDEPFSALDAITRFELQTLASRLLKNRTVFFITHDPLEALRLADEIYIMRDQPATLSSSFILPGPTPRDMTDPNLVALQTELFRELLSAKRVSS